MWTFNRAGHNSPFPKSLSAHTLAQSKVHVRQRPEISATRRYRHGICYRGVALEGRNLRREDTLRRLLAADSRQPAPSFLIAVLHEPDIYYTFRNHVPTMRRHSSILYPAKDNLYPCWRATTWHSPNTHHETRSLRSRQIVKLDLLLTRLTKLQHTRGNQSANLGCM